MIDFISPKSGAKLKKVAHFFISENGERFPIVNEIPRFVSPDNYARAFGLQWKTFAKIQLDSHTGTNFTRERLERCLGCKTEELKNKDVLEVGCGAGRFTELLVNSGVHTHSIDLSNAVETNKENIGEKMNYSIAQACANEIPYPKKEFDYVICLGVIQHTPSPQKTIQSLWEMIKPGGIFVFDHYKWRLSFYSTPAPYFRFFLRRMKPEKSQKVVNFLVSLFFPLHWTFRNNKLATWFIRHISPINEQIESFQSKGRIFNYETSKLETYDNLTDFHKHLLTYKRLESIIKNLDSLHNYSIKLGGNGIEVLLTKKN